MDGAFKFDDKKQVNGEYKGVFHTIKLTNDESRISRIGSHLLLFLVALLGSLLPSASYYANAQSAYTAEGSILHIAIGADGRISNFRKNSQSDAVTIDRHELRSYFFDEHDAIVLPKLSQVSLLELDSFTLIVRIKSTVWNQRSEIPNFLVQARSDDNRPFIWSLGLTIDGTALQFSLSDETGRLTTISSATGTITTDQISVIALVKNKEQLKLIVNGQEVASRLINLPAVASAVSNLFIQRHKIKNSDNTESNSVREIALLNTALQPGETVNLGNAEGAQSDSDKSKNNEFPRVTNLSSAPNGVSVKSVVANTKRNKFLTLPQGNVASFQWSKDVEVTGADRINRKVPVVYALDGLAPAASRNRGQLDYDAFTNSSESLYILFERPADSIKLLIGRMEENEWENLDETGAWSVYNSYGINIGNGVIEPDNQFRTETSNSGQLIRQFDLNTSQVSVLKLFATPYGHGNGSKPIYNNNNSDFNLFGLEFTIGEKTERLLSSKIMRSNLEHTNNQDSTPEISDNPIKQNPAPDNENFFNGNLPLGGIFYGNYESGLYTGNASIGYESARRFRAEKTGPIQAIRYNNRTLSQDNITNRCQHNGPESVWCLCENADLDRYTCGYTLGNSYTVGNGGSIYIEIYNDKDGLPDQIPLGRTRGLFIPQDNTDTHYPQLKLESEVTLTAGNIYHLVYRNLSPPENCSLTRTPVEEAAKCDRNKGAMGLNGTLFANSGKPEGTFDPFRGTTPANFFKAKRNGKWLRDYNNLSWYEILYSDGTWVGDSYAAYDSHTAGAKKVEGAVVARQRFTVNHTARMVDGIWLNFGHKPAPKATGEPLIVSVKNKRGEELATGKIAASETCREMAPKGMSSQKPKELYCRDWGYTNLSKGVAFNTGEEYSVEFSSTRGAGFVISAYFPLDYGVWNSKSRNHWNNAKAEVSFDSGSTWSNWANKYEDRDLGLLFTIAGKPKALH